MRILISSSLQIGQVLRYSNKQGAEHAEIDGLVNYLHAVDARGLPRALLEGGVNPIAVIKASDGMRRPAILISSSPHKVGSALTPWYDIFDVDNGHIRYFGDAKTAGADPASSRGNKILLAAHMIHSALDPIERAQAVPVIFFKRTAVGGIPKGHVMFQGFGIVERAERITQFNARDGRSFTNYVYDFAVLSLTAEGELFDWNWINARRDASMSTIETQSLAPAAWRRWIAEGPSAISRTRRRVSKLLLTKPKDQLPEPGSRSERSLKEICSFYATKKHRFEGLAYSIARRVLSSSGHRFTEGWITPASQDGGADFIGRLDIGEGFGAVRQIVYGQAKCVAPSSGVNGKDIARSVARLKRGWFGVFVTTSYFSEPVQREIIEDEYPILLIAGSAVAEHAFLLAEEGGFRNLRSFLIHLDETFPDQLARRRPEEILHL